MKLQILCLSLISIISILLIGILVKEQKDNYCNYCSTCQGMDSIVYPNRKILKKLYNEGKLTEFSDFDNHNRWKNVLN